MGRTTKQNKITSPELIAQINPNNINLIKEFLLYLQSTDKSKKTIYQYERDLYIFFVWNLQFNGNKFFIDVKKKDLIRFQGYIIGNNGNSPKRVRRIKSVLSSLSKYIEDILDEQYPEFKNIVSKIESPINQPVREKTVLDSEQVKKILDYLVKEKEYQKACFVALAAYSGSRKSELPRFKVSYFKPEYIVFGSLYKTPEKIVTKGKSSKGKLLYKYTLAKEFQPYLDLWLEERAKLKIDSDWLFVTKSGDKWIQTKVPTVDKWAERLSEKMGFPIYWHAFRHFFTTELKKHNIPDSVIKAIVGWESVEMVSVYNDLSEDFEIGKYFNKNGINSDVQVGKLEDLK